jgi:cell division protein FtsA
MASKEISVQNLAHIIQARMKEILDFVTYHLKQIGLDSRALNGGIVLTGGGAQLRHLIQLTEFVTGLNARIGYPNEHLAPNHIEQLKNPMYATCLGLILKGCDDYESKRKDFVQTRKPVKVPIDFTDPVDIKTNSKIKRGDVEGKGKGAITKFWEKFKDGLIELFKEEEDAVWK